MNLIFEALFNSRHWSLSSASEEDRGERQGCCSDAKALGKSGKVNHKLQHLGLQVEEDSERNQLSSSSHLLRELSSVENVMKRLSAAQWPPKHSSNSHHQDLPATSWLFHQTRTAKALREVRTSEKAHDKLVISSSFVEWKKYNG